MSKTRLFRQTKRRRMVLTQAVAALMVIACSSGAQQTSEATADETVAKASVQNAQKLSIVLPHIAFKRMSLESAVGSLLDHTKISYTLDGRLQTAMIHPLTLNNVSYDVALQSLLKASSKAARGHNEHGVYRIEALRTVDWEVKRDTGTASVIPVKGEKSNPLVSLTVTDASLYTALKLVFTAAKINYALQDDFDFQQIPVTANLHRIPLRNALDALLRAAATPLSLTYRLEDGCFTICEKKT